MQHWTSGYVEGLDYTHGFYRELTPALLALAALSRGQRFNLAAPHLKYCELGCGQGFSLNLLAAANPGIEFHANDFNPAHIAGARSLASEAGLKNVHFYEHAFADFADEPALPADGFDIIALHGIYSWVSAENRRHVIDFVARKLKPGGLVYVSYNALPGWAAAMPLRRILVDSAARQAGPIGPRIDEALAFADSLLKAEAGYFRQNSAVGSRLGSMMPMSRNYLAHEYFNRDWTPFYFEDVAAELSSAKLSYLGTVNLLDHVDEISLTEGQQKLLQAETDPLRRETLRDFLVNELFRKDLFAKGALPHTFRSACGVWLETRFALSVARAQVPPTIKGARGRIELHEASYTPILDAFAGGPITIRELLTRGGGLGMSWEQVTRALTVLVGAGHLQPCLPEEGEDLRVESCRAFNLAVCKRAEDSEDLQFLASPVTGGGLFLDRFEQLFLLAIGEGLREPGQWAGLAWRILGPQGQRLLKDGKPLETAEENIAELCARAEKFAEVRLPVCEQLKIVF